MRERFIRLAEAGDLPFTQLCARFGISRKTGYKWLNRYRAEGPQGLLERDRAPHSHPARTAAEVEARIRALAQAEPSWGLVRLREALEREGVEPLPALTTIDAVLRRAGGRDPAKRRGAPAPNDVWEVLIGPATVSAGQNHRAYVLRDLATGFVLAAEVRPERNEQGCRDTLWSAFSRHGLPRRLRWPIPRSESDQPELLGTHCHTRLTVELIKLGITVSWALPALDAWRVDSSDLAGRLRSVPSEHEISAEVRRRLGQADALASMPLARPAQETLERWRGRLAVWSDQVNLPTSGEVGSSAPAVRYRPSPRALERPEDDVTVVAMDLDGAVPRRVSEKGIFLYRGRRWLVGRAFAGETVWVRPDSRVDGSFAVFFCGQPLGWTEADLSDRADQTSQAIVAVAFAGPVNDAVE